jgi:tetratricopeptide (TPR) repeat protein
MIEGEGGATTVEPRIMQVLLVLADARGGVVSREDLLRLCWPGVIVGEESLNRAILQLRRAARAVGEGFQIETISKVGYRLKHAEAPSVEPPPEPAATVPSGVAPLAAGRSISRRVLLGAAIAAASGAGIWVFRSRSGDPRVEELVGRGRDALLDSLPDRNREAVRLLREAAAIAPGEASTWGWLALAHSAVAARAPPHQEGAAFREAEQAARRALDLDAKEPNALAALAAVREHFLDWLTREDSYRAILNHSPENLAALNGLTAVLQAVGRCRDSLATHKRVVALEPTATIHQQRKAMKHWIFGETRDADLVIDGALQRRPRHPLLWNTRLLIYAFTDRPRAALALIDNEATRPPEETLQSLSAWRASLTALETRRTSDVEIARTANLQAATRSHGAAANAVMILSRLGEVDAAYAVAEGFLLRRGQVVGSVGGYSGQRLAQDPRWRSTQWLFTPATRSFREDHRFDGFCGEIGLADYWRRRGVRPDNVESLARA